jgi:hypothetical protein
MASAMLHFQHITSANKADFAGSSFSLEHVSIGLLGYASALSAELPSPLTAGRTAMLAREWV